jgi:hypothetical protein
LSSHGDFVIASGSRGDRQSVRMKQVKT